MSGIRELTEPNFVAPYTRPRFGSKEGEQAWRDECRQDKERQKIVLAVARGCSVETTRGTLIREFEPVSAQDLGGYQNVSQLVRAWVVSEITEREAKTNRNEYEWRVVDGRSVAQGDRIWTGGFDSVEWDVARETFRRSPTEPEIVLHPGLDGRSVAEELVKRGLVERTKLRQRAVDAAKKVIRGESKGSSE